MLLLFETSAVNGCECPALASGLRYPEEIDHHHYHHGFDFLMLRSPIRKVESISVITSVQCLQLDNQ
jgi:hypothetical protein